MSKPYSILREKMKPAARNKAADKTKALLGAMPLQELRHARHLSQEQLAQTLSVKQAAVSKLVEVVGQKTRLKPRTIMQACNAVLEEADHLIENGKLKLIDADFAASILKDRSFVETEDQG